MAGSSVGCMPDDWAQSRLQACTCHVGLGAHRRRLNGSQQHHGEEQTDLCLQAVPELGHQGVEDAASEGLCLQEPTRSEIVGGCSRTLLPSVGARIWQCFSPHHSTNSQSPSLNELEPQRSCSQSRRSTVPHLSRGDGDIFQQAEAQVLLDGTLEALTVAED